MSPFRSESDPSGSAAAPVLPAPLVLSEEAADLLFREARTANAFTDEPVTDAEVRAIHDLVRWGPTAMNGQPMRVTLVRSPEARAALVEHLSPGNRAKAAGAPLVAILSYDADFPRTLPDLFPHAPHVAQMFGSEESRQRFGTFNGAMQAAYFLIGVRAAGLAAGPMGGFDAAGVDRTFFPDGSRRAFLVVNIGHPAAGAWRERLPRLDYDQVVDVA